MEKKNKRRRSVRLLSHTVEREDAENAVISEFEAAYGSIWKDCSPSYQVPWRRSTTGRRSGIFKSLPSNLLDTVDLIDRVDSPELSRAPEETSANNSVNADISATAPTSTEIDEQESRQDDITINPCSPETGSKDRVSTDFESPDYPEGIMISQVNNQNLCQSPDLSANRHSYKTIMDDSLPYSPSQPVFTTPSLDKHKSCAQTPISPDDSLSDTDLAMPESPVTSDLNQCRSTTSPSTATKAGNSAQKMSSRKKKTGLETPAEKEQREKQETSSFFKICKSLASKLANAVRRTPDNSLNQSDSSESVSITDVQNTETKKIIEIMKTDEVDGDSLKRSKTDEVDGDSLKRSKTDEVDGDSLKRSKTDEVDGDSLKRSKTDEVDGDSLKRARSIGNNSDSPSENNDNKVHSAGTDCCSDQQTNKTTTDTNQQCQDVKDGDYNHEVNDISYLKNDKDATDCHSESTMKDGCGIQGDKISSALSSEPKSSDLSNETSETSVPSGESPGTKLEPTLVCKKSSQNSKTLRAKRRSVDVLVVQNDQNTTGDDGSMMRRKSRRRSAEPVQHREKDELDKDDLETENPGKIEAVVQPIKRTNNLQRKNMSKRKKKELAVSERDQDICTENTEQINTCGSNSNIDELNKDESSEINALDMLVYSLQETDPGENISDQANIDILFNHRHCADFDKVQEFLSMNDDPPIELQVPAKRGRGKSKRRSTDAVYITMDEETSLSEDSQSDNTDTRPRRTTRQKRRSIEIYQAGTSDGCASESPMESIDSMDENSSPGVSVNTQKRQSSKRKVKEENIEDIYRNKNFKRPTERIWETIYESPTALKNPDQMLSKKRFKRAISFDTLLPAKIKKRTKKAVDNGWDSRKRKKQQLPDDYVLDKLAEIDGLLNN